MRHDKVLPPKTERCISTNDTAEYDEEDLHFHGSSPANRAAGYVNDRHGHQKDWRIDRPLGPLPNLAALESAWCYNY